MTNILLGPMALLLRFDKSTGAYIPAVQHLSDDFWHPFGPPRPATPFGKRAKLMEV
jgi:hypothetical protein